MIATKAVVWMNSLSLVLFRFRPQTAQKIDHLPNLFFAQLLFISEHVARNAVADSHKDFTIRRAIIPGFISQIRRRAAGQSHPTIALAALAVTRGAVSRVELLASFDRFIISRFGVLELLCFHVTARLLG